MAAPAPKQAFVAHAGVGAMRARTHAPCTTPRRAAPRAQATPPRRPAPPPASPPPEEPGMAAGADAARGGGGFGGEDAAQPVPPRDPTALRTESEVRRNRPAKRVPRRRRRGAGAAEEEPAIEWDKAESVPLVGGDGGADGWVDLSEGKARERRRVEEAERIARSRDKVDDRVIEKLKDEIVRPYNQNWLGIVVVAVAVLAVAFKVSGGFETIPIIPVPDL